MEREMTESLQTGGGQASNGYREGQGWTQNVVVMRHGDRVDLVEPLWLARADRPWDPPLTDVGKIRAWTTGKRLRAIGFPVHRVIVSPFLRCLQTAAEVITALCCVVDDDTRFLSMETSAGAVIDPTRVKVNIEYGLCEVFGMEAMGHIEPPADGMWVPDRSELEALLPTGTIDHSVDPLNQQLPSWGEPLAVARERYHTIIEALADKFPHENLLLVTHGEAIGVSVSSYLKDAIVYKVDYCAYTQLQRQVSSQPSKAVVAVGGFKLVPSSQLGLLFSS
uniref:UBASH3A-like protein isoform X1 n=2 Tax=Cymbidium TaxID=14366 RepID=A0A515HGK6_9ASPA|nr:UBASH3A-like protein isoform X1 [Cymbidium sinense]QDL88592.1 UBASH3A-like protein isoform X1 [Cymbidium goeringii]